MSVLFKRGPYAMHADLTPMIDVTFLLIVFFVLVSRPANVENVDIDLPSPQDPASELAGDQQHVVINVVPATAPAGAAKGYELSGEFFPTSTAGMQALAARRAARDRAHPTLSVNLRADRSTRYVWVEPVFLAVKSAAIRSGREGVNGRVNLVVSREP